MKKTIEFKTTDEQIQLVCESVDVISIPKNNLTIDGKKLFDSFISKIDLSTKVEFDFVDDATIDDANEKRIVADIKSIFNSIAQKINDKFKLLTEDVDAFLKNEPAGTTELEKTTGEDDLPF